MKIAGYTPLLYGAQFLGYAIRSVIDAIDEYHVIYSPIGAHGSRTDLPCPETRDELYAIASQAAGAKLHWHEGRDFADEGSQRMSIHQYIQDVDILLALDADEIWSEWLAGWIINQFTKHDPELQLVRTYRLPMVHYWRSFYRCIVNDHAYPVRVIFPKISSGEHRVEDNARQYIHHFGYAQTPTIVGYKWLIHGHKAERRHDINWFEDRFLANAQTDCHPVSINYWQPVSVNPWDYLPQWMKQHPFADKEVIE